MRRYVDLDLKYWVSVMLLVLSSWVPERLTSAPYLLVIGPTGSGKTTLLRFLSCLCRRGLLLGNLDTKTLCALPHDYRPTVLMDETVLTPNMCGLLRNGHARGVPVIYRGRPIDLYGPKVISSREPLQDSAFASRCIQIHLVPTRRKLLPLDKTALAMLSHVRSALLRYRFDTIPEPPLRSPHVKGLDTQNFTPRTKEMIRNFAGLFPLFEQFAFSISSALVEQERDFIAQRADDRDAHILRAVFSRCHDYPALTAGQISAVANECARSRGLSLQLSGRAVGPRLRALGLFTDSVGNLGLGIRFSQQNLTTIHELVRAYKLPVQPSDSCPLCRKWVRVVEKQEKKPATRSAERGRRAA